MVSPAMPKPADVFVIRAPSSVFGTEVRTAGRASTVTTVRSAPFLVTRKRLVLDMGHAPRWAPATATPTTMARLAQPTALLPPAATTENARLRPGSAHATPTTNLGFGLALPAMSANLDSGAPAAVLRASATPEAFVIRTLALVNASPARPTDTMRNLTVKYARKDIPVHPAQSLWHPGCLS